MSMTATTCSKQFSAPQMIGHADEASPRLAYVDVRPELGQDISGRGGTGTDSSSTILNDESVWLAACFRLTSCVERLSASNAVLDLGRCTEAEAVTALHDLVWYLSSHGLRARAGIAHSATLAQLALLRAGSGTAVACVASGAEAARAFLRAVPVATLTSFQPVGLVPPEVVERLQRYGLRTLGQIARLGEPALRRQFGATIGATLAALAQGWDLRPPQPTPRPAALRCRLRFTTPASSERVLAALPLFARRVATQLRRNGSQARTVTLSLHWERGARQQLRHTLRQHTDDADVLSRALRGMLLPALQQKCSNQGMGMSGLRGLAARDHVDELRIALGDFAPPLPRQATFWQTRVQRLVAAQEVATVLARRHGRPLVLCARGVASAAIFPEERHRLHALPSATGTDGELTLTPTHAAERHAAMPVYGIRSVQGGSQCAPAPDPRDPWRHVPYRVHWW